MKKLILLFILLSGVQMVHAQRYNLGIGMRAGVTNFLGDIGSGDLSRNFVYNMELDATRFACGPFVTYRFHPLFAVQGSFTYGRLKGEDSKSINRARLGRNLSFINDVFEIAGKFEIYPQVLSLSDVGYRGRYRTDFQTYFFLGLGAVIHSPKAEYNGQKYKLRPLMTEGERYSPVAVLAPMGGGFFFTVRRQHRIGFEAQWSWTFTDYLDDIHDQYVDPSMMSSDPMAPILANRYSGEGDVPAGANYMPGAKRGDPSDRDNYLFMTVSYQYMIRTRGGFYRSNYSWMYGRHRKWGGTKAKF